ncbi:MAG: hypothetical protein Q7V17_07145 [Afipia sp.]|nr:hypothetical protein [Afipia sp.]
MIIASRTLTYLAASVRQDVRIDIFKPEQDNGSWLCRYVINWPDQPWHSFGGGHDAVQALLAAMQKIGIELYASQANTSGQLSWDDWKGFGFPVPKGARDTLIGDDAKYL